MSFIESAQVSQEIFLSLISLIGGRFPRFSIFITKMLMWINYGVGIIIVFILLTCQSICICQNCHEMKWKRKSKLDSAPIHAIQHL